MAKVKDDRTSRPDADNPEVTAAELQAGAPRVGSAAGDHWREGDTRADAARRGQACQGG